MYYLDISSDDFKCFKCDSINNELCGDVKGIDNDSDINQVDCSSQRCMISGIVYSKNSNNDYITKIFL